MYAAHVPAISNGMRSSREIFERGVMFAMLSIRTAVVTVPSQLDDVWAERADSKYLLGWKRDGYRHLVLNSPRLWRELCAVPLSEPEAAMRLLITVPGLGIVKAGFVAQLMGFDVACLDSRNAEREGTNPKRYKINKGTPAFERAIKAYIAETEGRAAEYWDAWCDYVAADYKVTGLAISELHLAILPDDYIPF